MPNAWPAEQRFAALPEPADPAAAPPRQAAPVEVTRPEPGVAVLTLNRPETRNSLSLSVLDALRAALGEVSIAAETRVVVLAAAGSQFCAGHDLKELTAHRGDSDGGRAFYDLTMRRCSEVMQAIVACPRPVIAAVDGVATAAGCQLVATCDLAVASETARFCTPGVDIGLFCSTPMVALSRNVPRKRAMEMLLLGDMVSAADAERYGLVNRVVPEGEAVSAALELALEIAGKSPAAVAYGKAAFYRQIEAPLADAYRQACEVMVANMLDPDATEGIAAFLEKRSANWDGA
jgi:enoyl-CoA hydratase/carnithine racemase